MFVGHELVRNARPRSPIRLVLKALCAWQMGRTLAICGLGHIGCTVAETALQLGMNVVGEPRVRRRLRVGVCAPCRASSGSFAVGWGARIGG